MQNRLTYSDSRKVVLFFTIPMDQNSDSVEYKEGCPLCKHDDEALELELKAWASLLWDHYSEKRKET